ncbi:CDP-diacylglycerol--glycerol-3-phosphate 3-phosphatidyltransferase [Orbilia oligospora]|uniref:CDP-diacylglycerol--glycerol-3-phosphate 3-phosphatidyltransferase n=3 Tax=Orbilia oligospora TaxID=2813651 RepID=A0A7C8NPE0_ORBOL|nr:CDP-diacylglycerol--glycerol-3-phosphate 3-phosphatidyltransferase [Orbilia oligospora]KAF3096102.1 CDP-diacylglycerol--glycerol-3-phosphate 3-phosphatidyltransferase [Orbilia oligospora]KAF3117143.1 CDP-diacylglycerol--glycerol-3-phosphate 3-phosphatidyltransferase [Orbilia oligospora]KAF3120620.1 CDP-diacylglycerol--glycerol-3-phosphate 3-phosphatidyltransferase [Orbilia oligospora]KAF3132907.1 CDP-diacylglycerol--glycerol-3-phosphate 3-phosphatidyltransferase [Orbilia oligospora]
MTVRTSCLLLRQIRPKAINPSKFRTPSRRTFSFSSSNTTSGAGAESGSDGGASSTFSVLRGLVDEMDRLAPRFEVGPRDITILKEPEEFYRSLKMKILSAKKRVFIATLYIGKTEHELIETIKTALRNSPTLKVSILTDALRGTREAPDVCSASLLVPLVKEFGEDRVELRMFHTPNLRGVRKALIPKRLNEGWGLQHMKLYGFDDEIILSGANLSKDYFTNRQDRYHLFSSKSITDYYAKVHDAVCSLSFKVQPNDKVENRFELVWPSSNPAPSPLEDKSGFKSAASALISPLLKPTSTPSPRKSKTVVYPLGQFTPLMSDENHSTEHPGILSVLRTLSREDFAKSSWTFTAGYFNMHRELKELLLASKSDLGTVVTAAPEANGFYGSAGVSGYLPPGYLILARRFLEEVGKVRGGEGVELLEWRRGVVGQPGGWTYHAKGIWITLPEYTSPSLTVVGSSNYTRRSKKLDLEMNALVITDDKELQKELAGEIENLKTYAKPLALEDFNKEDKKVPWETKVLLWFLSWGL